MDEEGAGKRTTWTGIYILLLKPPRVRASAALCTFKTLFQEDLKLNTMPVLRWVGKFFNAKKRNANPDARSNPDLAIAARPARARGAH